MVTVREQSLDLVCHSRYHDRTIGTPTSNNIVGTDNSDECDGGRGISAGRGIEVVAEQQTVDPPACRFAPATLQQVQAAHHVMGSRFP